MPVTSLKSLPPSTVLAAPPTVLASELLIEFPSPLALFELLVPLITLSVPPLIELSEPDPVITLPIASASSPSPPPRITLLSPVESNTLDPSPPIEALPEPVLATVIALPIATLPSPFSTVAPVPIAIPLLAAAATFAASPIAIDD